MPDAGANKPKRSLTRRRFLLGTCLVAGGGFALRWVTHEKESLAEHADALEPNIFLQIKPDGAMIFQLDKAEMGQGTLTGLATLVAEELDVDPARLDVRHAPAMSPFGRPQQTTGGSDSLAGSFDLLRETGATARAMLLRAAADEWEVPFEQLATSDGFVINAATGERLSYGELAPAASKLSPPWNIGLKDPAEFRWIGKTGPRLDVPAKVTGSAEFGIDVRLDGMLVAVVARIPEMRAALTGYDADEAQSLPGVRGIVALDNGVAVVAEDYWSASQAAQRVKLEWEPGPLADYSDRRIADEQQEILEQMAATAAADDAAFQPAATDALIEATYTTPYLAHAAMEPLNATVHVQAGRCDIWTSTQSPEGAQEMGALLTGLRRNQVHVHNHFLGGGFGRRFVNDYVREAIRIARDFDVPVKLIWPREADVQGAYYRQCTAHQLSGAVSSAGVIKYWRHHSVAGSLARAMSGEMMGSFLPEFIRPQSRADFGNWAGDTMANTTGAFQALDGVNDSLYAIERLDSELETHNTPVIISIWRSVGASYTGFVIESFMDELAHAAGQDPIDFRLERLQDERHLQVLTQLKAKSQWGSPAPGRYQGVALFECFDTVVGQVAEVSVADKQIRVHKVTCVVDCGRVVNPDIVRQQMESGIYFGLTAALLGEINFDNGRVRQSNFHDYRMLRLAESPEVQVAYIDSDAHPTGVGEPGTPPIAAAVANAVFAATGQRLRSLPFRLA